MSVSRRARVFSEEGELYRAFIVREIFPRSRRETFRKPQRERRSAFKSRVFVPIFLQVKQETLFDRRHRGRETILFK